jgi:peptidyl-prolyl cis-trans isomerase D
MLDRLRKGAGGWVAQLFIALLVVSFAVWGVSGFFTGFYADTVATVGRTDILMQTFARNYETAVRQLSQQLGQPVSSEQAQMFGVPGQVLGRLVAEATLNDEAQTMGLGISNETLAREIADDPSFQGLTGAFDRDRFVQLIRNAGLTEDRYVEELRTSYVRRQVADGLVGETTVPDAFLRALHEYQNDERTIGYITLTPAIVGVVAEPTDTDITAWFEERKADWRAPEFRAVDIMTMTPADLADTGEVTDEEAKDLYDRLLATRFTTPERRKVEQIVFESSAAAQEAAAALAGGTTFDELIVQRGMKPEDVDLGLIARDKIVDPAVADAAFSLAPNSVSAIVAGQFGPVIVRVTTVEPAVVRSFDDAKAEIKAEIAEKRAAQEIADQVNVIEDARAGGASLAEIAGNYGLKILKIPALDRSGKDADGQAIPDLPGGSELVSGAFESDVGLQNNPIPFGQGYAWYDVTAVSDERDRELSEVREKVIAAWKAAETEERLTARANELRDRLASGTDIAAIAAELGLEAKTAGALKRTTEPPPEGLTASAILSAFGGPKGHASVAAGPDNAKLVLVTTETTVPPYFSGTPELKQAEEQVSGQIANDLLQQYIMQLQDRLGVTVNQAALQQAIGATQPGI